MGILHRTSVPPASRKRRLDGGLSEEIAQIEASCLKAINAEKSLKLHLIHRQGCRLQVNEIQVPASETNMQSH